MAAPPDDPLLVLCTVPAEGDHAMRLARGMVEERLAACVNALGPMRSIYRWQGAVSDDQEIQLLIKTRRERFEALVSHIRARHPYSEPEILALPIATGSASYLAWLAGETEPQ
jgi:periplasmic divalent cation tolerance protein